MKGKKKIIILGASGMLGSEILKIFSYQKNYTIKASLRNLKFKKKLKYKYDNVKFFKFDIKRDNIKILKKYVKRNTIIINCIGVIKPNILENDHASVLNAIRINSVFPYELNSLINKSNKIYQIATDCVFDGYKGGYKENSLHNAQDVYGKTKSLGEVRGNNFFNLRTSIIGKEIKEKKSLFEWFNNQKNFSQVNGYTNHLWNGLTTKAYAYALISIINNKINLPNFIHLIPDKKISKFNMLGLFTKLTGKKIKINPINAKIKIDRTLLTINNNLIKQIWKKSKYKKVPKVNDLIMEI